MVTNDINIGVTEDGSQAVAGELGKVSDALGVVGDESIAAADGLDKVAVASDRLSTSLNLAGRKIQLSASDAEMLDKAMGGVSGEMDSAAAATDRYAAATDTAAVSTERLMASQEAMAAKQAEMAINTKVANEALGSTYVAASKIEQLGTPALMKAATWSILGVGGVAYEGIKQYMNFNKLITQTITQAGVPASQMGALTKMTENISKMTGINLNDVANNLYRVASGTASWNHGLGATMAQLTNITRSVTNLQVLGNVPAGAASEQAARVITALVNSNIKGVGTNSNAAAALINAAVGSGDMRLNDLVPGIGRGVLQSAKANGMSAQDMLSWIALQTSMGTTASVAGNYVKTGINLLANPSAQGVLAESMIGIKPGEMQGIISGPGGLQAAVAVFNDAVKKLSVSSNFVGYRTNIGNPRAGGTGQAAALNKLETWMVGEMNPTVLKQWEHGGSAASGGLTAANQQWITDLIMTKAFGGSKQFATMAAILKNPGLLAGIESSISTKSSMSYYEKSLAIAENTPSMRFHKDLTAMQVDLVTAGKAMYPAVIKMVDGITWFVTKISTWKPALIEIGAAMGGLVLLAGIVKTASLYTGIKAGIGGIYEKLSPGGKYGGTARSAYQEKTAGTIADLGAQIRIAGEAETTAIETGDKGIESAVVSGAAETVGALRGVQATLAEGLGVRNVGSLAGRSAVMAEAGSSGVNIEEFNKGMANLSENGPGLLPMPVLPGEYGPRSPAQRLWMENNANAAMLAGAPGSEAFQADMAARNAGILGSRDLPNTMISPFNETLTSGVAADTGKVAAADIPKVASGLGKLAGGALGMVGGPIGIAMMVSTVLPLAMPYVFKYGSSILHWFGGGNSSAPLAAGVVTHYTQTQSQYAANIASYKKQLAQMNNAGYNPLTATAAKTAQWQNLQIKLNASQVGLKNLTPAGQLAELNSAWALTNNSKLTGLASNNSLFSGLVNAPYMGFGRGARGAGYYMTSQLSDISKAFKNYNGPGSEMIKQMLAGAEGQGKNYTSLSSKTPQQVASMIQRTLQGAITSSQSLLSTPEGQAALYGNKIKGMSNYGDYLAAQGIISKQANYKNLGQSLTLNGLTSANFQQRTASDTKIADALAGLAQSDLVRSHASGIGAAASGLYLAASKKAALEAVNFQKLINEMPNKLNGQKLDTGSMKTLATEIANALAAQGVNTAGMSQAFASALGVSGGALASIVNRANATAKAKQ